MEIVVELQNEDGLHARPAAVLVKEANNFSSKIDLVVDGKTINAKSIMGLMSLGLKKGAEITVRADGEDAEAAVASLKDLFINRFNLH